MCETLRLYTDGSCSGNPGPGGWAVVGEGIIASGCSRKTTNQRMEAMAILKAITIAIGRGYKEVFVYSDSEWSIKCIDRSYRVKVHKDIFNKIWKLQEEINVLLFKVKGHSGHKYNDLADETAKEAMQKELLLKRRNQNGKYYSQIP